MLCFIFLRCWTYLRRFWHRFLYLKLLLTEEFSQLFELDMKFLNLILPIFKEPFIFQLLFLNFFITLHRLFILDFAFQFFLLFQVLVYFAVYFFEQSVVAAQILDQGVLLFLVILFNHFWVIFLCVLAFVRHFGRWLHSECRCWRRGENVCLQHLYLFDQALQWWWQRAFCDVFRNCWNLLVQLFEVSCSFITWY